MPKPHHYAVVIGINTYPEFKPLQSAARDAEAFRDWLISPQGGDVPPANVKVITTPGNAQFASRFVAVPTRDMVNAALFEIFEKFEAAYRADDTCWGESRLYIYGSGHGIAPDANEAAVLMANAHRLEYGHSIGCGIYLNHLRDSQRFQEVVIFADCCRTESTNAVPGGPTSNAVKYGRGAVRPLLGFASEFGTKAYEPEGDPDRSYFTRALIEGLNGAAARVEPNGTRVVDSESLRLYMKDRVHALAEEAGKEQESRILHFDETIVFLKTQAPKPLRDVTVTFPASFTGNAVIRDGNNNTPIQTHDASTGPLSIKLADGFYSAVPTGSGKKFKNGGAFLVSEDDTDVQL